MGTVYTRKAEEVIDAEKEYIREKEGLSTGEKDNFYGLAFSGGGIRSASFGLGVLQALVAGRVLEKIDYLSTVSGGGYIGSSLTWFLKKGLPNGKPAGTKPQNFPFGQPKAGARIDLKDSPNAILDFIRQHGNYLIPVRGLNMLSLVAVALRALFVSLAVYFALFTFVMWLLHKMTKFLSTLELGIKDFGYWFFAASALLGVLFVVGSLVYSLITVFSRRNSTDKYRSRTFVQKLFGWILSGAFGLLLVGALPVVSNSLGGVWSWIMASSSTILGALLGFLQYQRQQKAERPQTGSTFQIVAGVFLLIYGLSLAAFTLAEAISGPISSSTYIFGQNDLYVLIPLVLVLFFGLAVNINYLSPHRMYRDRLMETFLPNLDSVRNNKWGQATEADVTLIEDMCQSPNRKPYHLINTNIVLVDSPTSKFSGRGGDNFVLSPLYCGGDATGWRQSSQYMKAGPSGGMTLPTAMAISGAALNPNTGVAGQGPSRNRLVSTLMSILNLRLGYWAPNPDPKQSCRYPPNFVFPGLKGGVLSGGLKESHRFIEISDGGHFENLALYELIRRRCRVIIVSDGGADPSFKFGDLANATERVRVDFGVKINFPKPDPNQAKEDYSLRWVQPGSADKAQGKLLIKKYDLAKRGFAVGKIRYPNGKEGTLLYLKTTMTPDLSPDIYGYKSDNPSFPDQTTADQFFDETQFEAYRELGYHLGWQMLEANQKEGWI